MLAIKLQRIGKKHQPSYRVVVAEKRSKLGAPPVEDLGSYSVSTKIANLKKGRLTHWMKMGAKPTATAWNLLVREGVVSGAKRKIAMKKVLRQTPSTSLGKGQDLRKAEEAPQHDSLDTTRDKSGQTAAPAEAAQAAA